MIVGKEGTMRYRSVGSDSQLGIRGFDAVYCANPLRCLE